LRYFLDTEFKEVPGSIDFISIGIVAEDGREYYAVNKGMQTESIWKDDWLRKNVIPSLFRYGAGESPGIKMPNTPVSISVPVDFSDFENKVRFYGMEREQIAEGILEFVSMDASPRFYVYYAAYDWVVFCWIFGRMLDLPDKFPKYCRDLKQMLMNYNLPKLDSAADCVEHCALDDARYDSQLFEYIKEHIERAL
jgi:hypothetical protein